MIFNSFEEPFGDDFGAIWIPKIDSKSVQNRLQEGTSKKGKNVKKTIISFSMNFEVPAVGKSFKNRP